MQKKVCLDFPIPQNISIFLFICLFFFSCQKNYKEKIQFTNKNYGFLCDSLNKSLKNKIPASSYKKRNCGIEISYSENQNNSINVDNVSILNTNYKLLEKVFEEIDSISTKSLEMDNCDLKNNVNLLSIFKNLERFSLENINLSIIKGNNFKKMNRLYYKNSEISHLKLGYLPSLYTILFTNVKLKDFNTPIKNIPKIKSISFFRTNISRLEDINFDNYPKGISIHISTVFYEKDIKHFLKIKEQYPHAIFDFSKEKIDTTFDFPKINRFKYIYQNTIIKDSTKLREKYPNINFYFSISPNLIL